MEYKPDEEKLKVICQRCGKTGEVGIGEDPAETGFIMFYEESIKYPGETYEYWLCVVCMARVKFGIKEKPKLMLVN